jgi:hypothetical protein
MKWDYNKRSRTKVGLPELSRKVGAKGWYV